MTKAILFDFDGTLVDSAPGIVKTMEQTFLSMGVAVPGEDAMRATIGLPLNKALKMLGSLSDEDAQKATDLYRDLFPTYEVGYVTVFPQVINTLTRLKDEGIRMAVVTSRDITSFKLIAERHGLSPFFETAMTAADGHKPKPAPDMVLALLERMNLKSEDALVVGDTTFDIEMGNAAGCRTTAVTFGYHSKAKLLTANPTATINSFSELTSFIAENK